MVASSLFFLWQIQGLKLTLIQAVFLQSLLALLLTRWRKLAWWWCVIQPAFPLSLFFLLSAPVSSWWYLLIFFFLLSLYWSTFQTQVPYFPSTRSVWIAIDDVLPANKSLSFIDIGSGLGGLVFYLAKKHPESRFSGVEIAPLPWLFSVVKAWCNPVSARFVRADYHDLDFSQFDVVFAYLSPVAMLPLWTKVRREMKKGSLFISYEFPIPQVDADLCIYPEKTVINNATLFVWRI